MEQKQYDAFISHSSKDKAIAFTLCEALENEGVICWIAPRDVEAGHYATSIVEGIESSKLFVLIFSQNSNDSIPVLNELEMAMRSKLLIIPARIEETLPSKAMKFYLMATNWFDVLDIKSLDDFKGFVSVVKKNLHKNNDIDIVETFKFSKTIENKKSKYLVRILIFTALLSSIASIANFFIGNKTIADDNKSLTVEKEKNTDMEVLTNKLIEQSKEAEYWKEEYFRLKEKYKEFSQLTAKAEKIKMTEGYQKAVNFYTNMKEDEVQKEKIEVVKNQVKELKKVAYRSLKTVMEEEISEEVSSVKFYVDEKYPKKALIIGNYNYKKLPKLRDISNKIDELKSILEELNFSVTVKKNLNSTELNEVIEEFSEGLSSEPNSIGLVYFSGHGSQFNNENYLIPIDVNKDKNGIKYKALNTKNMLRSLSNSTNKLNIYFLDTFLNTEKYIPSISSGTLMMYAYSGKIAKDNNNFIDSLINQIKKPTDVMEIVHNISSEVANITNNEQIPFVLSKFLPPIILNQNHKIIHKVFSLSNNNKLSITVENTITKQEKRVFCKGEILSIKIEERKNKDYLVVLSLNKDGQVILLQPYENYPVELNYFIQTKVMPPYGVDTLKFFALSNEEQYKKIVKLSKQLHKSLSLNNIAIENLYQILISNKNFREQIVQVRTIPMDKEQCYESVF